MKKGDIVLIPFPFTDLSGVKRRPALVLATKDHDIIVAFITSRLGTESENEIDVSPNSANGLKVRSILKLTKIATLEKSLAIGLLGRLGSSDLHDVDLALTRIFRING
ncbi:MAG: type II toxin-antitoxin system PemK/MazF family toxin [Cyclobacteriaceae bacterium]